MTIMEASLKERVADFYHWFAPHDASKAHIALSLSLPVKELFSMLATKYDVPMPTVTRRIKIFDVVESQLVTLGVSNPSRRAFVFLQKYAPDKPWSEAELVNALSRQFEVETFHPGGDGSHRRSPRVAGTSDPITENVAQDVELSPMLSRPHLPTPRRDVERDAFLPTHAVSESNEPANVHVHKIADTDDDVETLLLKASRASSAVKQLATDAAIAVATKGTSTGDEGVTQLPGKRHSPTLSRAEDRTVEQYHRKLVQLEAVLFQKLMEVQAASDENAKNAMANTAELDRLSAQADKLRRESDDHQRKSKQRDVELAELTAKSEAERRFIEETKRSLSDQQRRQELQAASLEEREARAAAQQQALAAREASLAAQAKLVEQERQLCQRLSAEVLKRETAVRTVEKSLTAAKAELLRLEDEVNARVKRLSEDEASTRRWAMELEKKDLTVQSIFEQLRHKGIHVSI